jgi:hypothetical protein
MERAMSNLRLTTSALTLVAGLGLLSPASAVTVSMDEVRVLTFNSPIKTVYVGNPTIANVTVIDSGHVFVLGKTFGTTNLVTLDKDGRETANERITVLGRQESIVTLQRGPGARSTWHCAAGRCEVLPTPGDDPFPSYNGYVDEIDKHQGQNVKSAAAP